MRVKRCALLIGKHVSRLDIPAKVDGSLKYGMDLSCPICVRQQLPQRL